jgi:hypothetical protein
MSDTLQKMAIALADVENELIRRQGAVSDEPSDEFRSIFDDHEDEAEDDFFDDEEDDSSDL